MTLDEMIAFAEKLSNMTPVPGNEFNTAQSMADHKQLAEWLKEYKFLKERQVETVNFYTDTVTIGTKAYEELCSMAKRTQNLENGFKKSIAEMEEWKNKFSDIGFRVVIKGCIDIVKKYRE